MAILEAGTDSMTGTGAPAPEYGSDVIVDVLRSLGLRYAAFNPGATFRGLHDSLVNHGGNGRFGPEIIECTHEEISVALAHGYAKATGEPMIAAVHNVVGLQHASMAIFNAFIDRAPVIVLGATGPMDATKRRPWIDWIHTALVQGNLVRDYVKWDDQPGSLAATPESLVRAYRVATTVPQGPVYVCLDSEIQEDTLEGPPPAVLDVSRFRAPTGPQADDQSLETLAEWLTGAEHPVLLTDQTGRNASAVRALVELAELLGAPVIDRSGRQSFLNTHDLDAQGAEAEVLAEADVLVAFDVTDLFGAVSGEDRRGRIGSGRLAEAAKIAHVTLEGLGNLRSLVGDYQRLQPEDLRVAADSAFVIPALVERCRDHLRGGRSTDRSQERRARHAARHQQLRDGWRQQAMDQRGEQPLSTASTALAVWDAIGAGRRPWLLANGTMNGWTRRLWDWDQPDRFLGGSGGAGLGYGIGAALGAALAHRDDDTLVVNIQSDGDFLFSPGALWTAAHHRLPMLTVMWNNRSYFNSEEHGRTIARHRNRPIEKAGIGTQIVDPPVDFATVSRGMGVWAEGPVERFEDLGPALERAIRVVTEQRLPALVDVVSRSR